jgi:DNA-directed RNA polymerase specialized sigma24 family protein
MKYTGEQSERTRELLSQAILEVLSSWPELHRNVFIQAHYKGQSEKSISELFGIQACEVHGILSNCQRRLCKALRAFRNPTERLALGARAVSQAFAG